jgi:hypothetical protein
MLPQDPYVRGAVEDALAMGLVASNGLARWLTVLVNDVEAFHVSSSSFIRIIRLQQGCEI